MGATPARCRNSLRGEGERLKLGRHVRASRRIEPQPRRLQAFHGSMSAGSNHCAFIRRDGSVEAHSENVEGQCNVPAPCGADLGGTYMQVSCGRRHTVLLRKDGRAFAIGWNKYRQCEADTDSAITQVSAGVCHIVLLRLDGTVCVVGHNVHLQCDKMSRTARSKDAKCLERAVLKIQMFRTGRSTNPNG